MESKPKLRFKEFSNEWVKFSFNDLADKKIKWSITGGPFGSDLKSEDYTEEGIRVIQLQNIGDGVFNDKNKIYTSISKADSLIGCNIFPNEIIISKMGDPVARACFMPIGSDRYLMSSDGIRFVPDNKMFNKQFVFQSINLPSFRKKAISLSTGSTRRRIGLSDLKKIDLKIPSLNEQNKIASFLTSVDDKINLLIKKKELLKQYKKGVMQKIFSQEIRFKDDNGNDFPDWEEKTLEEIANYRRGSFPQPYGLSKWYDDVNGFPFIQVYDVGDNMMLKPTTKRKISDEAKELSVFVNKGTIVLTIQGSIGRVAITQYDACVDRTLLIFESFKIPIDKKYFIYLIYLLFEVEKRKAPGGTIKTITKQALDKFKVKVPSETEQQKIGSFLFSLDKKIELVNSQIDKTKEFKKGLLQQMFV